MISRLRKLFSEKIVVSIVTCILLVMVLVAATTAWYTSSQNAAVYGLTLKTGGIGGIKVAVEPGGPDIDTFTEKTAEGVPIIPLKLLEFENIQSKKIAPGFYSPIDFYITPLAATVKNYEIKVKLSVKQADGTASSLTTEQLTKLESYVNQHIRVYTTKTGEIFSNPLTYYATSPTSASDGTAARGPLNTGENHVTLYWYWAYEYSDLPEVSGNAVTPEQIRKYDEEDTMIGNYIDNIYFDFYLVGTE